MYSTILRNIHSGTVNGLNNVFIQDLGSSAGSSHAHANETLLSDTRLDDVCEHNFKIQHLER